MVLYARMVNLIFYWGKSKSTQETHTSHRRHEGRPAYNLPVNFGEDRSVHKNFRFLRVAQPMFLNVHQGPEERPLGYP